MNELVYVKRNDVFTDSLVIAEETKNQHESIKRLIQNHKNMFIQIGALPISNRKSSGGRPEQFYELNEMQATFLITLLKNTDKVVSFKLSLVKEFYRMRQILMLRQTTEWLQTRKQGKLIRRNETDSIQKLIPYAIEQGSKNSHMFYTNYSKFVNKTAGIESGQREFASHKDLMVVAMIEDMVCKTIDEEIKKGTYYKEIYKKCKAKAEQFAMLTYLTA